MFKDLIESAKSQRQAAWSVYHTCKCPMHYALFTTLSLELSRLIYADEFVRRFQQRIDKLTELEKTTVTLKA